MTAVTDRAGATDAPAPTPAELAEIERFGMFEAEETVEKAARAINRSLDSDDPNDWMPRALAAASIAAMPVRPDVTRTMHDVADNLDYYASKTTGGTHATGLEDAAGQIRAAVGALAGQHATDEEGQR